MDRTKELLLAAFKALLPAIVCVVISRLFFNLSISQYLLVALSAGVGNFLGQLQRQPRKMGGGSEKVFRQIIRSYNAAEKSKGWMEKSRYEEQASLKEKSHGAAQGHKGQQK